MNKIIVIGGGAAGLMAACVAAKNGKKVLLLEKNDKLGKKIYITGKGRCNLTNNVMPNDFFSNIVNNSKFAYGCINVFSPKDTIDYFETLGLKLKTERGNRVFPLSNKASDVTKVLEKELTRLGVEVQLNSTVTKIEVDGEKVCSVIVGDKKIVCDSVIVCCGGISYPATGSTGDGYKFAKELGHPIIDLRPALVGIELCGDKFKEAQGVSLKNVKLTCKCGDKTIFDEFGEMLFTHFGVSGPIVLSCSSVINRKSLCDLKLYLDLKPALNIDVLDKRLVREFVENNHKDLATVMKNLLPKSLINVVLSQARVKQGKKCSEITQTERKQIVLALKGLEFPVKKLRPIDEAIVTSGGVNVKEINPKTMESKLIKGLFFAGEVVDVDAFTGGFNLQLAFSMGYVAGIYC